MERNSDIIAIYSRKSRFTGKGESIDNQVEMCRQYIESTFGKACADSAVVFEDEGFSGGNLNRPGFKQMMQAARQRVFQAVVVYRLDRISRNIGDFSALIEELGKLDIAFVSIRESFDTSSPMGRAMMYIASVFSQLERETIAERIRDNMHELAKTGRWLGGITPTGYTSESIQTITVDGKSKKACKLKLIPQQAELVKTIYELYMQTDSLTMTEAELLKRHLKTKTGHDFTRFSIKSILQNPVYLIADSKAYGYFKEKQADVCSTPEEFDGMRGILAYNRTDQQKGKSTVYLPISEWVISVGQHAGIIPSKIWIDVQQSLERNKSKTYRKPRKNEALLTGLLFCSCGSRMYPKLSQRFAPNGQLSYAYVCKTKEHSKGSLCSQRNENGNALDDILLQEIKQIPKDEHRFWTQLEKQKQHCSVEWNKKNSRTESLRRQQMEIQRKISALVDALMDFNESTAAVHIQQRLEMLHAEETELQKQMQEIQKETAAQPLNPAQFEEMRQQLSMFCCCVDAMTVEQKRKIVRTVVKKAVWDGTRVHIVFEGAQKDGNELLCEDSK